MASSELHAEAIFSMCVSNSERSLLLLDTQRKDYSCLELLLWLRLFFLSIYKEKLRIKCGNYYASVYLHYALLRTWDPIYNFFLKKLSFQWASLQTKYNNWDKCRNGVTFKFIINSYCVDCTGLFRLRIKYLIINWYL